MMSGNQDDRNYMCKPIDSLSEVYNYMTSPPSWAKHTIPLAKRSKVVKNSDLYRDDFVCHSTEPSTEMPARFEYGTVPKTLVCHDMKNGYLDDSPVDGSNDFATYSFYHWAGIDMFVYFSHHLVTIPPLGWINAAHHHGVQILGTVITEWNDGFTLCEDFLGSEDKMKKFAHNLVAIAKYFNMDGWLINIENRVLKVDMLIRFLDYLTQKMHKEISGSVVIWYDSVINNGVLSWQNCLNDLNMDFFNVCDGIFTNYCWAHSHLRRNISEAGNRKHDVYVGVDVWGRNFWGGGCFNTADAVREIHKYGLSMAIFAPAWTHEGIKLSQAIEQQEITEGSGESVTCNTRALTKEGPIQSAYYRKCAIRENFILRENALWNTLWPYLNTRGPSQLPFKTSFCFGSGDKKRVNGEVESDQSWFNLRKQNYQLSTPYCTNSFYLERLPQEPPKEKLNNAGTSRNKREKSQEATDASDTGHATSSESVNKIRKEDDNEESKSNEIAQIPSANIGDNMDANGAKDEGTQASTECLPDKPAFLNATVEETCDKVITTSLEVDKKVAERKAPIVLYKVLPYSDRNSCIAIHCDDSFYGGSCVKVSPVSMRSRHSKTVTRLFVCDFLCDHNFIVYYVVKKLDAKNQDLNIICTLKNNKTNEISNVVLSEYSTANFENSRSDELVLFPINIENGPEFKRLQKNLLENHPGFYVPLQNSMDWMVRYYCLDVPNHTILEISCQTINGSGSILLGGFGITKDVVSF